MSEIKIFQNNQFGEIRVIVENDEPHFSASDVCIALGYSNPRKAVSDHVDSEDVTKRDTLTAGGIQQLAYLNESGVYSLVFGSKLEGAKLFKKWVTSEVLPSIRKNGAYMTESTIEMALSNPDFLIQLATNLKMEKAKRLEAEQKQAQAEQLNEIMQPKALFADAVSTSDKCVLVSQLAKILNQNGVDMGQNRLFQWLRDNNYLCTKGDYYNQPSQKAMELGLFELKETTILKPDGNTIISTTTKVTGKGQIYFVNKFLVKKVA